MSKSLESLVESLVEKGNETADLAVANKAVAMVLQGAEFTNEFEDRVWEIYHNLPISLRLSDIRNMADHIALRYVKNHCDINGLDDYEAELVFEVCAKMVNDSETLNLIDEKAHDRAYE